MSSSSAGTRSSLHAFLWQAGTKSNRPYLSRPYSSKTGRCKAFCLLCYQKKLFFHFIRRTSGTSSKEVFQKYGGTAHPAKELSQRNVIQPFQCSFINSVGDASGVIDRGHCPVHRHTFCNGKTRTVQNLGSGPHSHRPTYHTDVFVPLRQ